MIEKAAFIAAFSLPALTAFNAGPLPSLYNQLSAVALFGCLIWLIDRITSPRSLPGCDKTYLLALTTYASVALIWSIFNRPNAIAVDVVLFLVAAYIAAQAGRRWSTTLKPEAKDIRASPLLWAMLFCAVSGSIPAIMQVIGGGHVSSQLVADAWSSDRISGNIRQPNQLATLSAWGIAAACSLMVLHTRLNRILLAVCLLLCFVVGATGSRIGAIEAVVIGLWSMFDRKLPSFARRAMALTPVNVLLSWLILQGWSTYSGVSHGRPAELASGRYELWAQCLHLISIHPWIGVGIGNFNFAWTLTPFSRANPETFDHAHNILLQWAVEMGVPATLLLVGLLSASFRQIVVRLRCSTGEEFVVRRFCVMMVVLVLLHSLSEYPLWYAYFLLPTAFAWGVTSADPIALSTVRKSSKPSYDLQDGALSSTRHPTGLLGIAGLLMVLLAAFAAYDYQKIVTIYHPFDGAPALPSRLADGQKALLYGYLADRFAGTLAPNGSRTLEPFRSATRQPLDMRMMISWALAMNESGQLDKARYLAQRIRDFNDPVSKQFFERCSSKDERLQLWQCTPPSGHYSYQDFQ